MSTSYDEVAYPSGLFKLTHPDRLAVMGKLHGLSPAPLETARVLEVGCGEGCNLMGMAAAYPRAHFEGFDLAATAIAAGTEHAKAAGLDNISLWVGDILDARNAIEPGSFDYISAHGVYAWVPQPVRGALMDLFAHALAPHGIAYVSYNALPGGYFRRAMRDTLLHEVGHIADPGEKLARAREVITVIAEREPDDQGFTGVLRVIAQELLLKHPTVLFHDELGDCYAPQSLSATVADGVRAGLRYLGDAKNTRVLEFVLDEGDDRTVDPAEIDRTLLRRVQTRDNVDVCFFRTSLFVRADAPVSRVPNLGAVGDLWVSTQLTYIDEEDEFRGSKDRVVKFSLDSMTAAFRRIAAAAPGRVPLREIIEDDDWRQAFVTLFKSSLVDLHPGPAPFVTEIGERPESSPLARAEIAAGKVVLPRLDHDVIKIENADIHALLLAANGERTIAGIAREVEGLFPEDEIADVLGQIAGIALMRA